MIDGYLNRA